jgi:hypothetical protein
VSALEQDFLDSVQPEAFELVNLVFSKTWLSALILV